MHVFRVTLADWRRLPDAGVFVGRGKTGGARLLPWSRILPQIAAVIQIVERLWNVILTGVIYNFS